MIRSVAIAICAAGLVVGATACGSSGSAGSGAASSAAAPPGKITIKNFAFAPAALTVPVGSTVTWTNEDSAVHTTTADKPGPVTWDSGNLSQAKAYSVKFTRAGSYSFHCAIHNYMTGTVTVTG